MSHESNPVKDGCMPIGAEIATEKARSAILFSRETRLQNTVHHSAT